MSALNKIAYFQNRRDEVPNQALARELAETKNKKGIQEIAENLEHKNPSVQSDCLKVLYEIGYLDPGLIADYVDEFLKLLKSKNNRMVWGSMIALATIAELKPGEIWKHVDGCHKDEFLSILEARRSEMTPSQLARLRKITRQLEAP